jgi:aspartyl-tRNA(Asn)/glutamyl-tRNA(Gln) amidotransferase subunit A
MGPLAAGTDGGGSVRIPAGFCGIVGFKPTYGRIPLYPASPFGTLSHAGPMTRSVQDAALMLDVISGFDARDWSALPPPAATFRDRLDGGAAGCRIAFSPDLGYAEVDPEVAASVRRAVEVLAGLGAAVEEVDPGFADPVRAYHVLWFAGAAKSLERVPQHQRELVDPGLREICEEGRTISASEYLDAVAARMALGVTMGEFHERFDLLVTPTLPIAAFAAGHEVPPGSPERRWTSWTPFTYPFNLTQQPAITVPCGSTASGLPVGLQIVGPRHADERVLAVAGAYQRASG